MRVGDVDRFVDEVTHQQRKANERGDGCQETAADKQQRLPARLVVALVNGAEETCFKHLPNTKWRTSWYHMYVYKVSKIYNATEIQGLVLKSSTTTKLK